MPINPIEAMKNFAHILTMAAAALVLVTACEKPVPENIKVSDVKLNEETIELTIDDDEAPTVTLKATVAPNEATNKAVKWSSNNEGVASVDERKGVVTAFAAGIATITATTEDGGKTATCIVTVADDRDLLEIPNLLDLQLIPDPVFLAYCEKLMATWDTNGDGGLSPGEAAAVTNMDVANISGVSVNNIASLTGIEHFTGLRILDCHGLNNLTELDVSACVALETLICWGSSLTELNVAGCAALEYLDVSENTLTVLNVSHTPALRDLKCSHNRLAMLDLLNNPALTNLKCDNNRLTSLYVSNCVALQSLECYRNELTILDVSKNTALTLLDCYRNKLAALDVSKSGSLRRLICGENLLAALDVSQNTALDGLNCDINKLTALDLSANRQMESFSCVGNRLSTLTVGSGHDKLNYFRCSINELEAEELNGIFRALPDLGPEAPVYTVYVDGNPGAAACDVSLLDNKNWQVYRQDTRSGSEPQYKR
jgi:Leucine-rich repeat (LRR) protein